MKQAESVKHPELDKVARWFIAIRWIASACVPVTLIVAQKVFAYPLSYRPLYGTAIALAAANIFFTVLYYRAHSRRWSKARYSALFHSQIVSDYVMLLLLVYFSGFLENPFSYFFVFHVMLTSYIFRRGAAWKYVGGLIAVLVAVAVLECAEVLPHFSFSGEPIASYRDHVISRLAGLGATLAISAYLISSIRHRFEEKGKAVEIELDRYKALDRIKSNFLLQVTHELRGPVAAVSGYHEMILRGITGAVSEAAENALRKADRRTANLLNIIDEMIDYAYMRSDDEPRYRLQTLDLSRIVRDLLDLHSSHAEDRRITLAADCPPSFPIVSNRDLLNILLGNLINNAIKYSPEHTTVRVTARMDGPDILLEVQDQGYGIEGDQLEQIFEEFYRTRQARELERDGTGLGLPIVKRAVETLGGRITVYSEVGKGSSFQVRLPVREETPEEESTQGEADEEDSDH